MISTYRLSRHRKKSPSFFNDTATTEIYTLSLHDALPIYMEDPYIRKYFEQRLKEEGAESTMPPEVYTEAGKHIEVMQEDRKSTRLNSSHANISYAVFCLKKKHKR